MAAVMIDIRAAVGKSVAFFQSINDLLIQNGEQIQDLRLEETELSEDRQYWLITLGYDRPIPSHNDLFGGIAGIINKYQREWRVFKVDAETGEVLSMKIPEQ
jgi:hypothetical protein